MRGIVREHLKDLNVQNSGGIIIDKIRVDTINNPMLVIGIGGTGIDALLRVKYQVNRKFILGEDSLTKTKKEKPDNIEFLAFETNQDEKNKKYRGIGLDPQNELVLLSNAEIGSLLQNRSTLDSCITSWLSPELNVTDGMKGASGNRQAGRLLLFTKINEVIDSIEKKIELLLKGSKERLYVFLLTGISGGTGSGCFIDISYIIRGIMENKSGAAGVDRVSLFGYIFTPDVNLSKNNLGIQQKTYIMRNGYAALKELDYLMNIADRREHFKQRYKARLNVDSQMPPFDYCNLISATNKEGKTLVKGYEYCMDVTAENITNFMASEDIQSGEEFAIQAYMSNVDTTIKSMVKPYSANYKYSIIGAASAVLPIEHITTYLAYKLFKKMEKMFEQNPSEQEIKDFIRLVRLDKDSVEARFQQELKVEPIPGYESNALFSYDNVIKNCSIDMDSELEGYSTSANSEYLNVRKQYPGEIMLELKNNIRRLFLEPNKGPFYVSRMLMSNNGFCVIKTLETIAAEVHKEWKGCPEKIKLQRRNAEGKYEEARKALLFTKEKKKNDYIDAKIEEYYCRAEEEMKKRELEFYHELIDNISEQNNGIYRIFTEILNELNKIFDENGDILIKSEEILEGGSKTYYWNVVTVPDVVKTINKVMEEEDSDKLIRNFTKKLLTESQKWIDEQHLDIVNSVSDFISDEFGDIITKSMEEFLTMKYGEERSIDRLIQTEIAPKLQEDAVTVFDLSNSDGSLILPSWGLVSVPANAEKIRLGIENFKENSLGKAKFTIRKSRISNRIFWLNTDNGVPLYAYTPIRLYEKYYEDTIFDSEGIGRHLIQTRENNWAYLPSPIPEKSWGSTYLNERIKNQNEKLRSLFKTAIEIGCIKNTDNLLNAKFRCIATKAFDIEQFLKGYSINSTEGKVDFSEMARCIKAMKNLISNGIEKIENHEDQSYYIFDSKDIVTAEENFLRSPELIRITQSEVNKYESLYSKVKELENVVKELNLQDKLYDDYIRAMYTGTILKKGMLYVYNSEEDTINIEWPTFANLIKDKGYAEYKVFLNYINLDEKKKIVLDKKSDKLLDKLAAKEDTDEFEERIKSFIETCNNCKEQLYLTKHELLKGDEMYMFYNRVLYKLNEIKEQLAI